MTPADPDTPGGALVVPAPGDKPSPSAASTLNRECRMPPTIHAAAEAIRQGTLTPVDLVEQCLERVDRCEERVRAWVFVDRDHARAEAKRLTDELRHGQR